MEIMSHSRSSCFKHHKPTFILEQGVSICVFCHVNCQPGACNPGACHTALNLAPEDVVMESQKYLDILLEAEAPCAPLETVGRKPFGAIRASLGYPSTFEDVFTLYQFIVEKFVR